MRTVKERLRALRSDIRTHYLTGRTSLVKLCRKHNLGEWRASALINELTASPSAAHKDQAWSLKAIEALRALEKWDGPSWDELMKTRLIDKSRRSHDDLYFVDPTIADFVQSKPTANP